MNVHDEHMLDAVAALAVGALPATEAHEVLSHLDVCATCRAEYRALASAVGVLAEASDPPVPAFSKVRAAQLKERIVRQALEQRPATSQARSGYARVVPRDELLPFAPGIAWSVVTAPGMTLVYWVFDPPECGELPAESHAFTQGGIVLEGAITLHYGDGTEQTLRGGDVYAIAPGTIHGASFAERTTLLDVYTPNHAEFEALYEEMRLRAAGGDVSRRSA